MGEVAIDKFLGRASKVMAFLTIVGLLTGCVNNGPVLASATPTKEPLPLTCFMNDPLLPSVPCEAGSVDHSYYSAGQGLKTEFICLQAQPENGGAITNCVGVIGH